MSSLRNRSYQCEYLNNLSVVQNTYIQQTEDNMPVVSLYDWFMITHRAVRKLSLWPECATLDKFSCSKMTTGDPLYSRAALHTARQCKYTQPCSFARLCSENGGLARLCLRWVFTDTICNRRATSKVTIAHLLVHKGFSMCSRKV